MRVHAVLPSRERPAALIERVRQLRTRSADPKTTIEVVLNSDDTKSLSGPVMYELNACRATVTVASPRNKVAAFNSFRCRDWDVVVGMSDDMEPASEWDVAIDIAMRNRFPCTFGALHFDDGLMGEQLCTVPVLGRRLYNYFGFIYDPAYKSLFCDQEQTELLRKMGRISYVPQLLFRHQHHTNGAPNDALYQRNDAMGGDDREVFNARQASGFFLMHPVLSALICTTPERSWRLEKLLDWLYQQVDGYSIEIRVDAGEGSIGAKRQRLLEAARGEYVCFIDDDDWTSPEYLFHTSLAARRGYDCVELHGVISTDNGPSRRFHHSTEYSAWDERGGVYVRCPNHLNAIKRSIALQIGYKDMGNGEDRDFSERLRASGLCETQASIDRDHVYYYWHRTKKGHGS